MTLKLFIGAISKIVLGILAMGLLIFLPAGTFLFPNGWLLMILLFTPMLIAGVVLMLKNPTLLERRLRAKETQKAQRVVVNLCALVFLSGFVIAGLDFRFGWTSLPKSIILFASLLFLFAYLLYAEVIRENTYLSRTIEVQEHQTVIDRGLYRIVRHPMYAATILLFLSMPLILGSLPACIPFLMYPFLIAVRIRFEEAFLKENLVGYADYCKTVKYRLIPWIW